MTSRGVCSGGINSKLESVDIPSRPPPPARRRGFFVPQENSLSLRASAELDSSAVCKMAGED